MKPGLIPLKEHAGWQSEQLFTSGDSFFAELLQSIDAAEHSIDMNFYIVELDQLGRRIIDALTKAKKRGVRVRFLMDGIGSAYHAGEIATLLSAADCEVRIFHPLPFTPSLFRWSIMQGNLLQKLSYFLFNINQRNHYKLCIIDNQQIWSGSFNISARHLSTSQGGENWRDYGIRLGDGHLQDIQCCFDTLWGSADRRPMLSRLHRFRANLSLPMRKFHNRLMLYRIGHARQRIWICNAYFAPSAAAVRALIRAGKNGVDVRLILPSHSDVLLFPAISQTYYAQLLKHGIKIHEYQPRILHAKVMLLDEQCWIGSTNMNHSSFYHDMELDLVLEQPATIARITEELQNDMADSVQIDPGHLKRWSLRLFFARFLRFFRYWL